jgi:tetratricopeptide (TPR) repeat protein
MTPRTILVALVLAFTPVAEAEPLTEAAARELLAKANADEMSGRHDEAIAAYEQLVAGGFGTADVQFNLGTARLHAGKRGLAILAFERALRLEPGHPDAQHNLEEARRGNIDKLVGAQEETPLLERLGERVPGRTAAAVFLAAWLAGWAALLSRRWLPKVEGALGVVMGLCLAVALVSAMALLLLRHQRDAGRSAIVVSPTAAVREGPAADFKAAFDIHEGLKVRVIGRKETHLRVRLPNGAEGWVAESDAPEI